MSENDRTPALDGLDEAAHDFQKHARRWTLPNPGHQPPRHSNTDNNRQLEIAIPKIPQ
jgi:hypothetical protein